jgi:hypothetical protein
MKLLLLILLLVSNFSYASPFSTLYVKTKDDNICIFTNGGYDKAFDDRAFVYLGAYDGINAFHSSYSKIYPNFKMPVIEKNCIIINAIEFNKNLPYDIMLETNKSYSRTICVKKDSGVLRLLDVKYDLEKGVYCGSNQYDYSSNSLWTKLKNLYYWIVDLFN